MKKLPYGVSDFEQLRKDDFYFVDKTRYIRTIEDNANFLFFFRPRRFGKSLLTNMLLCYYDIKRADKFEELFGGLWIGDNPTKDRNKYLVLRFDFSLVAKEIDKVEASFNDYIILTIREFVKYYAEYFTTEDAEFILSRTRPSDMMNCISSVCKKHSQPVYLIIDEYDNFTNAILFSKSNRADYEKITHGTGFYRDFFQVCKPNFTRIFMTGVSPVTYDDLTSGYNIGTNLTLRPAFNGMLGFTEEEVREMIRFYIGEGMIKMGADEMIEVMKPWYDNCCFAEDSFGKETVYNSDSVLYFLNAYFDFGRVPKDMIDPNTRTDYAKLKMLVNAGTDCERTEREELIESIIAEGEIVADVVGQFPAETLGEQSTFLSLMFYYGVLTFGGKNHRGQTLLKVTNKCMRVQYLEYMQSMVSQRGVNYRRREIDEGLADMAFDGEWKRLMDYLGKVYHDATTVRCSQIAERYAQAFFQGMIYLNPFYCVLPEVEANHGYCDLLLFPEPTSQLKARYTYIIELKYLHSGEGKDKVEELVNDAEKQLRQYAADSKIVAMAQGLPTKLMYLVVNEREVVKVGEM